MKLVGSKEKEYKTISSFETKKETEVKKTVKKAVDTSVNEDKE